MKVCDRYAKLLKMFLLVFIGFALAKLFSPVDVKAATTVTLLTFDKRNDNGNYMAPDVLFNEYTTPYSSTDFESITLKLEEASSSWGCNAILYGSTNSKAVEPAPGTSKESAGWVKLATVDKGTPNKTFNVLPTYKSFFISSTQTGSKLTVTATIKNGAQKKEYTKKTLFDFKPTTSENYQHAIFILNNVSSPKLSETHSIAIHKTDSGAFAWGNFIAIYGSTNPNALENDSSWVEITGMHRSEDNYKHKDDMWKIMYPACYPQYKSYKIYTQQTGDSCHCWCIAETGCHHSYTAKNTAAQYLKSAATHASPAVYYYSCSSCGAKGTETFTSGSAIPHSYTLMLVA